MKTKKYISLVTAFLMLLTVAGCSDSAKTGDATALPTRSTGKIYLYGEAHSVEKILNKEFELWNEYYRNDNMRHLFVELPYYTAAFLNMWMQSDSDDILEEIYKDFDGTQGSSPQSKAFYLKIKSECPETIFHGTDVGHQYQTTGERFLKYLENNNLDDTEQYLLAQEAIEQGEHFYIKQNHVYRENKMAENFIREFDSLNGVNVMGIYGGAHTGLGAKEIMTGSVPCMANQLKARYGDAVYSEDLSWMAKDIEPSRVDTIKVGEKDYEASYYGIEDLTRWSKKYTSRKFWRLENAYEDFKNCPKTGDVLPYDNYPMLLETGQVFVIDYTKPDGSVVRMYYRSEGHFWNDLPSTEEFKLN